MFYTQPAFIFTFWNFFFHTHPLEALYIVHDHIDASFHFLRLKDFYITHEHIDAFCLFLLQKDLGAFHELFLKAFLGFLAIAFCHFYIQKKIYICKKNILSVLFIWFKN